MKSESCAVQRPIRVTALLDSRHEIFVIVASFGHDKVYFTIVVMKQCLASNENAFYQIFSSPLCFTESTIFASYYYWLKAYHGAS